MRHDDSHYCERRNVSRALEAGLRGLRAAVPLVPPGEPGLYFQITYLSTNTYQLTYLCDFNK